MPEQHGALVAVGSQLDAGKRHEGPPSWRTPVVPEEPLVVPVVAVVPVDAVLPPAADVPDAAVVPPPPSGKTQTPETQVRPLAHALSEVQAPPALVPLLWQAANRNVRLNRAAWRVFRVILRSNPGGTGG